MSWKATTSRGGVIGGGRVTAGGGGTTNVGVQTAAAAVGVRAGHEGAAVSGSRAIYATSSYSYESRRTVSDTSASAARDTSHVRQSD